MKNKTQPRASSFCPRSLIALLALIALGSNPSSLSAQQPAPSAAVQALLQNAEITPEGGINFYTTLNGKRQRSLAITPRGSLVAGVVSRVGTPFTNEPPVIDPVEYDKAGASGGRNWVHDFYFGRFGKGDEQLRLYSRGMFLWGRGGSPDFQLGRMGPDNTECTHTPSHDTPGSHRNPLCQPTTYGPPADNSPDTSFGKIVFVNWGEGEFEGDLASSMTSLLRSLIKRA